MNLRDLFDKPSSPIDLLLGSDHFQCRGIEYPYSAVRSLWYYSERVKCYSNFQHIYTTIETKFDIHIGIGNSTDKNRPSCVSNLTESIRILKIRSSTADDVREAYVQLAEKTFDIRMSTKMEMLKEYGCFLYDGKRFFPDGRASDGKQTVNLQSEAKNRKLFREPFKVYVELPKSLLGKVMHRLAQKDTGLTWIKERNFVISTEYDADVFFALLARLFALRWP